VTSEDSFSTPCHPIGGFKENPYLVLVYDCFETCSAHPATRTKTTSNTPKTTPCFVITPNKRKPSSAIKEIRLQKTEQKECLVDTIRIFPVIQETIPLKSMLGTDPM
jgi:hypothetical protein